MEYNNDEKVNEEIVDPERQEKLLLQQYQEETLLEEKNGPICDGDKRNQIAVSTGESSPKNDL